MTTSLSRRLLLGSAAVLAAFVLLTGLSVSWSVHRRAEAAALERLQGLVYGILGATDVTTDARLTVRDGALPERALASPTAGLYAEIVGNGGEVLWRSASSVASVPATRPGPIGEWRDARVTLADGNDARQLQLQSVWQLDDGQELPFLVHVIDARNASSAPLARFDRSLFATLAATAVILLLVQLGVLRAALGPLRRLGRDIDAMTRGERDVLDEHVPGELAPLARSVNALHTRERRRHERARHLLDDLAHNLKTPLAVLSNLDDVTVHHQAERMQRSIDRYLQRAAVESTISTGPPVPLLPVVERCAESMRTLYRERAPHFTIDVAATTALRAPESDLYEVIGNLLDNACKYGARTVHVSLSSGADTLLVDDDGPGFAGPDPERLLRRGARADVAEPDGDRIRGQIGDQIGGQIRGQGLGLAGVDELVSAWGGHVRLERSPAGGARCALELGAVLVG